MNKPQISKRLVERLGETLDVGAQLRKQFAALSAPTQPQPFMYGIQGPNGKPEFNEHCVDSSPEELQDWCYQQNGDKDDGPYKVVALYTAPQSPVSTQDSQDAKLLKAAKAFAKAHIDCEEFEDSLEWESDSEASETAYEALTDAYITTKAALVAAYRAAMEQQQGGGE